MIDRITKFDLRPIGGVLRHQSDEKGFKKLSATVDLAAGIVIYDVEVFSMFVGDGNVVPVYTGHSLETAIAHYNEAR